MSLDRENLMLMAGEWNHKQFSGRKVWSDENVADFAAHVLANRGRKVQLGVIEFHSQSANPGLIVRFYEVMEDLRESGSIVDLYLHDIAAVLGEFGYEMEIYKRGAVGGNRQEPQK